MKKNVLLTLLVLLVGIVVGFFINSMTVAKYNTINATCTVVNAAVDNNFIKPDQVVALGKLTKAKLGDSQAAKDFNLTEEQIKAASTSSVCSQFFVGMNQQ